MGFEKRLWTMSVIYIISMFMIDFQSVCGCLERERVALWQLRPEFRNPYKSSDCCIGWDGVVCDANGRVLSLSISNSLNGEFNASVLLPLDELQELDLSDNSITYWIESKGSKKLSSSLTKLEVLNLNSNMLDGNILSQLSGFQSLKQLSLQSNLLSGMILVSDIEAMKNLEVLDLSTNSIEGFMSHDSGSMKHSPSASKLYTLDLSSNPLNMSILRHMRGFQSVKTLTLKGSQFSGVMHLNDFRVFNNLEVLDLTGNGGDKGVNNASFFNDYEKLSSSLPKLNTLYLWYNSLDNSFLPRLSALPSLSTLLLNCNKFGSLLRLNDFEAIKNLEELYLANNGIEAIITDGPVKLSQLKLLDLTWNALNSSSLPRLRELPSSLKRLWLDNNKLEGLIDFQDIIGGKNLEDLRMSNNNILGFKSSNGCSNSTSLQMLDLYRNQISGDIPSCLESLPNLRVLNLSLNHFTGNIGKSPLVSLHSLEILQISQNQFQIPYSFKPFSNHTKLKYFVGDSNQVIPDDSNIDVGSVASGLQLEVLSLSNCAINGPFPNFLRLQHDLRFINLAHNSLQGTFPSWMLEKNPQLNTLLLINNSLTGALEMPSHADLWALDISQNKLEGHIPPNIGLLLPKLYVLNISRNQFHENIPPSLCSMKSLQVLDLSNNRLSRGIEHLSKGCFQLSLLDISNNSLEGEIPPELLNIKSLDLHDNNLSGSLNKVMLDPRYLQVENLILSNNFLEGPLTKDICALKLQLLDLSYNKLNGSVPSCLTNSSALVFVLLNNNKFNGCLTLAFSNSSNIQTLDLSFNSLTGPIPNLIECQHSLRSLLLKGNFFYGQIPSELCKLSQVAILDLSHNNLSGLIPHCLGKLTDPTGKGNSGWVEGLMTDLKSMVIFDLLQVLGNYENDEYWWGTKTEDQVEFMTKSMTYDYKGDILQYMSGVDLSCNGLTGEVPLELGNLNWLHALNLSHNQLRGHIPMTFSNLKQMESLDLSYNFLNGSIPKELAELDSLGVFKVGYNNLSGKIPFEAHFITFDNSSYEGNPFLCGRPLSENCSHGEWPPIMQEDKDIDDDDGWIDMGAFYVTFAGSYVSMFLAVVVIMWVNSHWRRAWFYLVKVCIFSSYTFMKNSIRKLTRATHVS